VLGTVLFVIFLRESGVHVAVPASLPALGLAALGLLMVSPIPYHSFKNLNLGGNQPAVVVMVFALLIILAMPGVTLFAIGVAYVSSGPIGWFLRKRSGKLLEPAEVEGDAATGSAPSSPTATPSPVEEKA